MEYISCSKIKKTLKSNKAQVLKEKEDAVEKKVTKYLSQELRKRIEEEVAKVVSQKLQETVIY